MLLLGFQVLKLHQELSRLEVLRVAHHEHPHICLGLDHCAAELRERRSDLMHAHLNSMIHPTTDTLEHWYEDVSPNSTSSVYRASYMLGYVSEAPLPL